MDNVFGALGGIFSSSMKMDGSNENSKRPWIFKNLSRSFIKIFQKKTWGRGFWAQPLPLLQNHYPIQPLKKTPPPPPPL